MVHVQGYRLDCEYQLRGERRRVIICSLASEDSGAIATAHAVADLAEFEGASGVAVAIRSDDGRDVAIVGGDDDEEQIERPTRCLAGYRSDIS